VSIASGAGGQQLRLTVKPHVGYPMTRFLVGFTAPRTARYEAIATSACGQRVKGGPKAAGKGTRLRVTLPPTGKRWCTGTVHARVLEVRTGHRLARFSFRVVAQGTDARPPSFAGLKSAFACTPGPQTPGETTPFTLMWSAATDNQTSSSQIVYDVYMSTTQGGEDFSKPNWTTAPGITTFKTPGLASHGTFYFVVRARDQAGNEEHNDVERRGVDPCL
jgi:hypothetical protein